MRELNAKTAEAEDLRRRLQAASQDGEKRKAKEEAWKKNPHDLLAAHGFTLEDVVKGTVERKYVPQHQRAELPEAVRAELDELKAFKREIAQERQTAQQQAMRTRDEGLIKSHLEQHAERYPYSAALGWSASAIVGNTYAAKQTNAEPALVAFEKSLADTTAELLGNERVVKALLASKPGLKEALTAALGLSATSNEGKPEPSGGSGDESADGPRSLGSLPSGQTPPRPASKTRAELKREATRDFAGWKKRQKESDE